MLIDCHVHVNNYDEENPRTTADVADDLFRAMSEAGVGHAIVLTSYKVTPHRPHVDDVIALLGDDPRVSIVEGIRWRSDGERTDLFRLEERIVAGAVRGIKLYPGYDHYPINDPSLESVFRIAAKHDVPVMVHTGDTYAKRAKVRYAHPLLLDDVAVDYPEVRFVMCHLGNPWFYDAAEVLYKNDNVYGDISGLVLKEFSAEFERVTLQRMRDMIQYMGDPAGQLLYGSDWPLVSMRSYARFFADLELTAEQRERIGWRNAVEVFGLDPDAVTAAAA